jgi:hypothetical protein
VINKDIKHHYVSALDNLKSNLEDYRKSNENYDIKDVIYQLHEFEIKSLYKYFEMYENNSDCFSNPEYSNMYNHTRRKLEAEINKECEKSIEEVEKKYEVKCKKWLEEKYYEVEKSATIGLNEYIKCYNR